MSGNVNTIEKIACPTPDIFYTEYVKKGRPVIITGIIDNWPALEHWDFKFFKKKFPTHNVVVERSHVDPVPTDPTLYLKNRYYETHQLGEVISIMQEKEGDSGLYVTYANIFQGCPELLDYVQPLNKNFGFPKWYGSKLRDFLSLRPGFWLGPAGSNSPTHFDRQENLNVQICGHKKWTLFSPTQSKNLYFAKKHSLGVIFSPIDINNPDLETFPLFKNAECVEAILKPGEVIYIPPGWWHQVQSLDETITLNFWWWSFRSYKTVIKINFYYILQSLYNFFVRRDKKQSAISMPTN